MKKNVDNIIEIKMPNHLSFKNNKDDLLISIGSGVHIAFNNGRGYHAPVANPFIYKLKNKSVDDAVVAKLVIKDNIIVLDFYNKENLVNSTCCYTLIKETYEKEKEKPSSNLTYSPVSISYVNSKGEVKLVVDYNCDMFNFGITPKRKYRK